MRSGTIPERSKSTRRKPKNRSNLKTLRNDARIPRVLDVYEFAQENKKCVQLASQSLHQWMQIKLAKNKKQTQLADTSQFNQRRRTTSHRRYKIPIHRHQVQSHDVTLEDKCRAHRRKPSVLRATWNASSDADNSDEQEIRSRLHLWHAKRMHMILRYGFLLPARNTSFGDKGAQTIAAKGSILYDRSHYQVIELSGTAESIAHVLLKCNDFNQYDIESTCNAVQNDTQCHHSQQEVPDWLSPPVLSGQKQSSMMIFEYNQFPQGAICPVQILWCPSANKAKRHVRVSVHPAAWKAVYSTLTMARDELLMGECMEISVLKQTISQFQLVGVTALRVISSLLNRSVHSDSGSVLYTYCTDPRLRKLPSSQTPISASVPLSKEVVVGRRQLADLVAKDLPVPRNIEPTITQEDCVTILKRARNRCSDNPIDECSNPESSPIWSMSDDINASVTPLTDQQIHSIRRRRHTGDTETDDGHSSLSATQRMALCIVQLDDRASAPKQQAIEILCNSQWTTVLWHALMRAGCKAVGMHQIESYFASEQIPMFPRDYVDTVSGMMYWECEAQAKLSEYKKKSKPHTVNYNKIRMPTPFGPDWNMLWPDTGSEDKSHGSNSIDHSSNDFDEHLRTPCPERDIHVSEASMEDASDTISELSGRSDDDGESMPMVIRGSCYLNEFCGSNTDDDGTVVNQEPNGRVILPSNIPRKLLVQCSLRMWDRGNPVAGSIVCLPSLSDIKHWNNSFDLSEVNPVRNKWCGVEESLGDAEDCNPSRTVIGFVTSAMYSRAHAVGQGIALVRADGFHIASITERSPLQALQKRRLQFKKRQNRRAKWVERQDSEKTSNPPSIRPRKGARKIAFVLIRNPESRHYKPAILHIERADEALV